jgi:hypothetical protein
MTTTALHANQNIAAVKVFIALFGRLKLSMSQFIIHFPLS